MDLAVAAPGDLVVVFQSGAYGATASPQQFLSHPELVEVLGLMQPGAVRAYGRPAFVGRELADLAALRGTEAAWLAAFERYGTAAPEHVTGPFAVALRDAAGRTFLAVDRFAICTLCFRPDGDAVAFDPRADAVARDVSDLDPQAIFDYLYFHAIPAPRTIFRGVERLPAGHYALYDRGNLTVARWWKPAFVEDVTRPLPELKHEFRGLVRAAIAREAAGATNPGCFLSGGTDSSTVAGLLGEVTGRPARTFSIGFDVHGYDEMAFARIAARHFGTDHHEYYVTPDDLLASIPAVASSYDQPFGNSSVLPAYYCAKLARDSGVDKLFGGDGGDELFGGNTRYAKQRVFGAYDFVPAFARKGFEAVLGRGSPLASAPLIRKAVSYVEQARVPMPDRMQMYNLVVRLGLSDVLTQQFLSAIDVDDCARQQREVYAATNAHALVNRMLAFDWRYTLADNDLPKVMGAAELAGIAGRISVARRRAHRLLATLAPAIQAARTALRWFFKEALRGFLPDEILTKKKHGFGLAVRRMGEPACRLARAGAGLARVVRWARHRARGVPARPRRGPPAPASRVLRRNALDPDDARAMARQPGAQPRA